MRCFVIVCILLCSARPGISNSLASGMPVDRISHDSIPCDHESPLQAILKPLFRYASVIPAYNDNDGFMAGPGVTNVYKSDSSAYSYVIAPVYSFTHKKVLGAASIQYGRDVNHPSILRYFGGLTLRSFDMQRNPDFQYALRYTLFRPLAGIILSGPDHPNTFSRLTISASVILEEEALFTPTGSFSDIRTVASDIYRIRYDKTWCTNGKTQGYAITAEQQWYGENHYLKITGDIHYAYPYRKDRYVYFRFFGAAFPLNTRRQAMGYQNTFTRGTIALIHQGFNDYAYDDSFFSRRNQDRAFDNQVSLEEGGGFKTPVGSAYTTGMSNNFAASVNWSADTPFKTGPVDLRIFIDAGVYSVPENGKMKTKSMYSGGFSLHYRDIGAIHLPLVFNSELANTYREVHKTFLSRISFSLNIERLLFGRPAQWNVL
jgi:hypothetical protein